MSTINQTNKALVPYTAAAVYHAKQSHKHAWSATRCLARGVKYGVPPVYRFIASQKKAAAKDLVLAAGKPEAHEKLHTSWVYSVGIRATGVLVPPAVAITYGWQHIGYWAGIAATTVLLSLLAIVGSRGRTGPVFSHAPKRDALTQDRLDSIFRTLGLLNKPKEGHDIAGTSLNLRVYPHEADGGVELTAELPIGCGKTAKDVAAAKPAIASEMGVSERQLWITPASNSAATFTLWRSKHDPFAAGVQQTPLLNERRTSVWEPMRLGTDVRGKPVMLSLMFNSVLVGGLPRQGKSNLACLIAAYAALDPFASIVCYDGKAGADFKALGGLADRLVRGADPEDLDAMQASLDDLVRTMNARYRQLDAMPRSENPENKLTRAMAEDGMPPVIVLVDEISEILDAASKAQKEAIVTALTRLARKGPACGITLVVSTQRPDASSVPTQLSGNLATRIALPLDGHVANDIVLGTGAHTSGLRASELPRRREPSDPSLAILKDGADSATFRVDYLPPAEFDRLCDRGEKLRAAAGTLRNEEQKQPDNLLDAARSALGAAVGGRMTATQLANALGLKDGQACSYALRPFGLSSRKGPGASYFYAEDAERLFG